MAVSENAGDLLLTKRFEEYRQYAGFSLYLCHGRDPQTKGKIEKVIQYVKGNFMSCRTFNGIAELNSAGLAWLDRTGNGKKHETTTGAPARPADCVKKVIYSRSSTGTVKTRTQNSQRSRYFGEKNTRKHKNGGCYANISAIFSLFSLQMLTTLRKLYARKLSEASPVVCSLPRQRNWLKPHIFLIVPKGCSTIFLRSRNISRTSSVFIRALTTSSVSWYEFRYILRPARLAVVHLYL